MLLCKQPGDAAVFATATTERVSVYNLAHPSLPLREAKTVTTLSPDGRRSRPADTTSDFTADLFHLMRPPFCTDNATGPNSYGRPLTPMWSVPFSKVCGGDADVSEDEANTCVPFSISLNCASGALRLFVSGSGGGAWVGGDEMFSALSLSTASPLASACPNTDNTTEALQSSMRGAVRKDDIVTSGWSPRDQALLAIGRYGGAVQFLHLESSSCSITAHATVLHERVLQGTMASLDWVPGSETVVVAARQPTGCGCYMEVIDLRLPEVAIRYLGPPPGAVPSSSRTSAQQQDLRYGAGAASTGALCFAELIACDNSQKYVATAGGNDRCDVLQLWDLRMSSRPVCAHVHAHLGYTSLTWVPFTAPTVVSTTRRGGLWMHNFADFPNQGCSDSEESEGREKRQHLPLTEDRHRLHSQVPVAVVAALNRVQNTAVATGGGVQDAAVETPFCDKDACCGARGLNHVASGQHTKLPWLVLLDGVSGELYPQVALPRKIIVSMISDVPVWSTGPNVFGFSYGINDLAEDVEGNSDVQLVKKRGQHTFDGVNKEHSTSAGSFSGGDFDDESSEVERVGEPFLDSMKASVFVNKGRDDVAFAPLSTPFRAKPKEHPIVTGVRRPSFMLRRLREGFVPYSNEVFSVLLQEGMDREAYVLFRYGWYMQRYIQKGKAIASASYTVPGLLELAQKPESQLVELILRAVGWCIDVDEEKLMLQRLDVSAVVKESRRVTTPSPGGTPRMFQLLPPRFHSLLGQYHQELQSSEKESTMFSSKSASSSGTNYAVDAFSQDTPSPFGDQAPLAPKVEMCDCVGAVSQEEAVERRAAILTCMGSLRDAAQLLSRHSDLCPPYAGIAFALENSARGHFPAEKALSSAGCSYWMSLCIEILGLQARVLASLDSSHGDLGGRLVNAGWVNSLPHWLRCRFFTFFTRRFPYMLIPDQIALATVLLLPRAPVDSQDLSFTDNEECGESWRVLGDVLGKMIMAQFDPSQSCGRSLFLSAAVEKLDANCASVQRYIDETGDVQTPVVYFALYGSTKSKSWRSWNDAYRNQLNNGGHWMLRSSHDLACTKMAQLREKARENSKCTEYTNSSSLPHSTQGHVMPLAVNFVGRHFSGFMGAPTAPVITAAEGRTKTKRATGKGGVVLRCKCGHRVPTFPASSEVDVVESATTPMKAMSMGGIQESLCKMPDCLAPMCVVCSEPVFRQKIGYTFEESFTWCTVCLHGGHWKHLSEWFAKHRTCPAEDCLCRCRYPLNEC